MPPLSVIGITLEAGEFDFAMGATLLFVTNLVGVILAAGITFVLVGFSPWFHLDVNRAQVNRSFATVAVALLVIAIPLTIAGEDVLTSVTDRGKATTAVTDWLEPVPGYEIVEVSVAGNDVRVVVVGSGELPPAEGLANGLAGEFNRVVSVDLSVIPEERYEVVGEPSESG